MTTLQEYLDEKYSSQSEKEHVEEIDNEKISQEREESGETELLGGESLNLINFKNLEKIKINPQFSKTSLNKLIVNGLTRLREIVWLNPEEDSEENKKLWTELGIENDFYKKRTVREIQRLVGLFSSTRNKKVNVNFVTKKTPPEVLKDKNSLTKETNNEFQIYLQLEREDKLMKFSPKLILRSLIWELPSLSCSNYTEDLSFWSNLKKELKWVEGKLDSSCKSWIVPLNPSNFPFESLEAKEFLTFYFPNDEEIIDSQLVEATVDLKIVNNTWENIIEKIPELIKQELTKKGSNEENRKELAVKATIEKSDEKHYVIKIEYHSKNPVREEMKEMIGTIPLKLELEKIQEEKKQLPTLENYEKMIEKVKFLEKILQDNLDRKSCDAIRERMNGI